MRRPDLGEEFDGWQVVDPTPQEKSAGVSKPQECFNMVQVFDFMSLSKDVEHLPCWRYLS